MQLLLVSLAGAALREAEPQTPKGSYRHAHQHEHQGSGAFSSAHAHSECMCRGSTDSPTSSLASWWTGQRLTAHPGPFSLASQHPHVQGTSKHCQGRKLTSQPHFGVACSRDRPWLPPAAGVLPPAHWSSLTFIENFVSEFCTHTGIPMAPDSQIQQQAHSWPSLRSHSPGDPRPLLQLQVLRPPGNTHTGTEQKTRSNGKQLERGFNKKQGLDCSDVCRAQSDKNTIYQTPSLFTPSGGSSCEVPPPGEPQCSLQLYGKFAHLPLGHQWNSSTLHSSYL